MQLGGAQYGHNLLEACNGTDSTKHTNRGCHSYINLFGSELRHHQGKATKRGVLPDQTTSGLPQYAWSRVVHEYRIMRRRYSSCE